MRDQRDQEDLEHEIEDELRLNQLAEEEKAKNVSASIEAFNLGYQTKQEEE